MTKNNTDIDIDVADRKRALKILEHVSALRKDNKTIHNVGVYFQEIPKNPLTNAATVNFVDAENLGYFKVDILNNNIYSNVRDENHLDELLNTEPNWDLLEHKEIVEKLAHIHSHFEIVEKMKPKSIEELAMVIAMIRPGKKHLVGKKWNDVKKEIWEKPDNDEYYFKKSHSIAYSASIVVQLNLLIESLV